LTIAETAAELHVRMKTVRNLLARHRKRLGAPFYVAVNGRAVRDLSDADVATLRAILVVYRKNFADRRRLST
jgi:orotate phosphoribosyltransferase-like protein